VVPAGRAAPGRIPALCLSRRAPALLWAALLASSLVQAQAMPAEAEPEPAEQVHWALGAFFGTGWYQVEDNRSVFVLRIPPRQTLREAALGADGARRLGVEILYPVALGLSKLDRVPDFVEFDNFASVSFTPGVELEVPLTPAWALRPYLHLGYGRELESGEGATIWYGGVKSRYRLGGARQWSLLNEAYFAGYKPEFENRGRYGGIMAGLEWRRPLQGLDWRGAPLYLDTHLTYDWFFDELNFHVDRYRVESFRDQWELGLALGGGGRPLEFGFLSFDHVGLAYRWSSNGNFDAITLNLSSPFMD
jgi:opacity protein-like surface antigen